MDQLEKRVAARLAGLAEELEAKNPLNALELRQLSFQVYLSDPASVRDGGVYFCGLKPYGASGTQYAPPRALPEGFTTYRDQPGSSPFYPRAGKVIRQALDLTLGPEAPLEAAFCTNWFFQRAADTVQLKQFGLAALDFSSIHRELLKRFQPAVILCVGNGPISSYTGVLSLLGRKTTHQERYLGNSYLRGAQKEGEAVVIGLPHLSRYTVEPALLDFMRRLVSDH